MLMWGGDNNLICLFSINSVHILCSTDASDRWKTHHAYGVFVLHNSYFIFNYIFCLSEFEFGSRFFGKIVCDAIGDSKCLVRKRKTVKNAQEVLLLWVELGVVDAFLVLFFLFVYLISLSLNVSLSILLRYIQVED